MDRNFSGALTVGLLIVSFLFGGCQHDPEPGADLVLLTGRVYTLAWEEPTADGIRTPKLSW
ncbi:MAG: hypothetical protein WBO54_09905 [Thermoanaerobaculia bacterium]